MTRFLYKYLVLSAVFACATFAWGQNDEPEEKKSTVPPGRKTYMGRDIALTMSHRYADWLSRDNREANERCSLMLAKLGLNDEGSSELTRKAAAQIQEYFAGERKGFDLPVSFGQQTCFLRRMTLFYLVLRFYILNNLHHITRQQQDHHKQQQSQWQRKNKISGRVLQGLG